MATVAARDLRNHTSGVLQRAQAGEEVVITVRGRPVARLVPLPATELDAAYRIGAPTADGPGRCGTP